jgi:hypothetical protein
MDILQYKRNPQVLPDELSNNTMYREHYYSHAYFMFPKNIEYIMYVIALYVGKYLNCKYIIYSDFHHDRKYLVFGYNNENALYNYIEWYKHGTQVRITYNNNIYTLMYYNYTYIIQFDLYGNIIGHKINNRTRNLLISLDNDLRPSFLKAITM